MPQAQLPFFPSGTTEININLAFEKKQGRITYFSGTMPVFSHDENDRQTFRMIISQFYINGNATQAELYRAFSRIRGQNRTESGDTESQNQGTQNHRITESGDRITESQNHRIRGQESGDTIPNH